MTRRCEQIRNWILSHATFVWLTAILLLSLLLKIICWRLDPTVSRDGCFYLRSVQVWYETGNFRKLFWDAYKYWTPPPLPLYLMKSLMYTGMSAEAAGVALNIAMGTFTPLISYGIAYEIIQRKDIAVCAALLTAVSPAMNDFSHEVQRDMIYLFLIGLVLWFLAAGIRRQKWWFWFGAGIFSSCAVLTRFETAEFFLIVPLTLAFLWFAKYSTLKTCFCHGAAFFASLAGMFFLLTSLTQTQGYLFSRYKEFYQGKLQKIERTFHAGEDIPVK